MERLSSSYVNKLDGHADFSGEGYIRYVFVLSRELSPCQRDKLRINLEKISKFPYFTLVVR